jgi:integrase
MMQVDTKSAGDVTVPASTLQTGPNGTGSRDGRITVRELATLYFAEYTGRDETRPQRLGWWVDRVGDVCIGDLTDDLVADHLDALAKRPGRVYAGSDADGDPVYRAKRAPMSGATINRYASALSALCTFAIKRRKVPRTWPHPVHLVDKRKENPGRTRFLDREEAERLLQACRASKWPRLHLFVRMALVTGCRRGELERLRWRDVEMTEGFARIHQTKSGKPKVVPLTDDVVAEMQEFRGRPDELLFPSVRRSGAAFNVTPTFDAAVKRAGLRGVCIHTLRHSCASLLVANGATLFEVQQVLGHTTPTMSARYSHLAVGHKTGLVRRVFEGFGK